jgi:hypothetical protein
VRDFIRELGARLDDFRERPNGRPVRAVVRDFSAELGARLDDFRERRRGPFGGVAGEAIVGVILVASLLTLGVVAARAVTGEDETFYVRATTSTIPLVTTGVVTETTVRDGTTVRIVRRRTSPGDTVLRTIPGRGTTLRASAVILPGGTATKTETATVQRTTTVHATRTVTMREIVTVTEIQTETVTNQVVETVTVTVTTPGPPGPE